VNGTGKRRWRARGAALLLAGLGLAACASSNKAALERISAGSGKSIAAGDLDKAIGLYRSLYEKDPQNAKIAAAYVAEVEAVKRAGDRARRQGSSLAAQAAYRVLIDDWDAISAIAGKLRFMRTDLEAGLKDCRIATYERLFRQELRAGHHDIALAVYQDAAREYPGDMAVKAMCAKGVGEIRAAGAKASAARDFALAGKILGLLKAIETAKADPNQLPNAGPVTSVKDGSGGGGKNGHIGQRPGYY
jgi:tetratricopeptide (TPR) repeat protein